jgi:hypothetical protein
MSKSQIVLVIKASHYHIASLFDQQLIWENNLYLFFGDKTVTTSLTVVTSIGDLVLPAS